jgi:hypothetical protein
MKNWKYRKIEPRPLLYGLSYLTPSAFIYRGTLSSHPELRFNQLLLMLSSFRFSVNWQLD